MNVHLKRVLILLLVFTFVFQMAGVTSLSHVQAYADTETEEALVLSDADEAAEVTTEEIDTESPGEIETDGENPPDAAEEPAAQEAASEETAEVPVETPADETVTVEETAEPAEAEAPMLKAAKAVDTKSEASNGVTVLAFSSDVHNGGNNGGDNSAAIRLGNWIDIVESKEGDIDVMAFGGDMARMMNNDPSGFWDYAQSGMDQLTQKGVDGVYTTGNHEYSYGGNFSLSSYNSGAYASNTTQGQYTVNDEAAEGNNYRIYCLGSESGSQSYTNQISSLTAYLNRVGNDKPIFIITHFPLHALSGRNISGAASLIEVLNNAVTENGQMIIFLWGHNHSVSDTYYDQIYGPGTTLSTDNGNKTIQFYYGAAGCMSDDEYSSGSRFVQGKGLVVTITPNRGNATMEFTYYNEAGKDVTEDASIRSVDVTVPKAADTVSGYVITIGDMALTANPAGDDNRLINNNGAYIYTGLAGVSYTAGTTEVTTDMLWQINPSGNGYTIQSMDGKYLSATYASNGASTSNPTRGDLSLSETADIWTLDGSFEAWSGDGTKINSTNSGKTLTYYSKTPETGSNQTDINLFTVGSSKTDRAQTSKITEAEIAGETTPVTGVTLDKTEETVEVGKTVKLTATIEPSNATNKKVTWSSSNETVATVNNGTVTGVAEGGPVTITATTEDGEFTAACTVTVTASTTPRYELVSSLEDGGEYLIVSTNSVGSGYALKNLGGSASGTSVSTSNAKTSVTIQNSDAPFIEIDDSDIVWTAATHGEGFDLTNNGEFFGAGSRNLYVYSSQPSDYWTYSTSNQLVYSGNSRYIYYYNNSYFYSSSSSQKVYLFKKVNTTPVAVTGVTIDQDSATVKVGKTTTLTATITPTNATNNNVTWSSSNTAVATVDSTGKVTGVAVGNATITATTADGGFTDTCAVTVEESSGPEYYLIKIGNYIMSCESEDDYMTNTSGYEYHGLEKVTYNANEAAPYKTLWILEETDTENGYYIKSASGQYLSASYVSNSSNGYTGTLTVGDTKDIWVVNSGLETWQLEGSYLKSTNASVNPRNVDIYLTTRTGNNSTDFFTVGSSSNYKESQLIEPDEIAAPVAVTGVTVSPTTAEVTVGHTTQLTATVAPENADNKSVTWSSDAESVATVDANGFVTGVSAGTATITVTTEDGGKTATCTVTVNPSTESRYELVDSLENGGEYLIVSANSGSAYALKNPGANNTNIANANYKTAVTIESGNYILTSDTDIVWTAETSGSGFHLSNGGLYLEGSGGNTSVFSTLNNSGRSWTYSSANQLQMPGGSNSTYTLRYRSGTNYNYFQGSSSTSSNTYAVYLFKKAGTDPVSGVTLSQETLNLETGETATLTATVLPSSAGNKNVTWSSSNEAVATVENGVVTAVGTGNATITVTTVDGGKTATCDVTVTAPVMVEYVLTDTLKAGDKFIIASSNTVGDTAKMLYRNGEADASADVTVAESGGETTITTSNTNAVFTAETNGDGFAFKNGNSYYFTLEYEASGTNQSKLQFSTDTSTKYWLYSNYQLTCSSSQSPRYLYYSGSNSAFVATTSGSGRNAYVYVEKTDTPHTHTYGTPEYTWAADNSTCTATVTCTSCEEGTEGHSVTETVTASHSETTATCTTAGSSTYTATFTNTLFTEQTKVVEIPATGHSWGEPVWTWDGFTAATAKFTCANDSTHTQDVNATITSATQGVVITYTATAAFNGQTYTDHKVDDSKLIKEASATFTLPIVGDDVNVGRPASVPEDANYTARVYRYQDANGNFLTSGTFEAGKTYYAEYSFDVKDGYGFKGGAEDTTGQVPALADRVALTANGVDITEYINDAYTYYRVTALVPFTPENPEFNLTVNAWSETGAAGTATLSKTKAHRGDEITVTATPAPGSVFTYAEYKEAGSIVNGTRIGEDGKFIMPPYDTEVTAFFKKAEYTVTVTPNNEAYGTASASYQSWYNMGDEVTLTATPNEGYEFKEWKVLSGGVTIANNKFTVGTENVEIQAVFAPKEYTLTFLANEGDTEAYATVTKAYGAAITEADLPAAPTKAFYTFNSWTPAVPATMPAENKTFTATWTAKDAYYLIGSMTGWEVVEANEFVANPDNPAEYSVAATLTADDQIKVAKAVAGEAVKTEYYPSAEHQGYNGQTDNYTVDQYHAGNVTVYFRPAGNFADPGWQDFGGYFYIEGDHAITVVTSPENTGTATVMREDSTEAATSAPKGMALTVNVVPADDYELDKIEIWKTNGGTAAEQTLEGNTFNMPDYDVTVKVYFKAITWKFVDFTWEQTADGYNAIANYRSDNGSTKTVAATVTSRVTTAATCEGEGQIVYTATVTAADSLDGKAQTADKTVTIPAIEHDWKFTDFTWTGSDEAGYTSAVANYKCKNDATHTQTVNATVTSVTTAATCEVAGKTVYTATVAAADSLDGTAQSEDKPVAIPATDHDWNAPVYEWTSDHTSVTATRTCKNDASHVETETAAATDAVTTPATCTQEGVKTWTSAEFTNPAFEVQRTTEIIPKTGHDWDVPTYVWAEDYTSVTATRICKNDPTHVETDTAAATGEVTKAATCTEDGVKTWTSAAFSNTAFAVQTTTEVIPATGHVWIEPAEWTWIGDDENGYTGVQGTFICQNDSTHTQTVESTNITSNRVEPTPTQAGKITYSAKITGPDNVVYSIQKEIIIPPAGYTYKDPVYTWTETTDGYSVAALKECNEDQAQNISETVTASYAVTTAASCEATGVGTYTAVFTKSAFATQTKTVTIPALGHDWNDPTYEWNTDHTSVTAAFVCKNDAKHTDTATVSGSAITSEITTQPTATTPGVRTYTASITFGGKTYTATATETIPATGASVSGNITSFVSNSPEGAVSVELFRDGSETAAYTATVSSDNKSYAFAGVDDGTYTMKVSKKDHATRTYEITVAGAAVTQDVKIHLIGDINGDGEVTTIDAARTNAHAKGATLLTGYEIACGDINGSGDITTIDAARVNAHAKGATLIWE